MQDLGLDSLDHVEVIMAMEDEFGKCAFVNQRSGYKAVQTRGSAHVGKQTAGTGKPSKCLCLI